MKTIRNISGIYFRVERDGKWKSICYEDLTDEEQIHMLGNKNLEWHKSMIISLSKVINDIGEAFNITNEL